MAIISANIMPRTGDKGGLRMYELQVLYWIITGSKRLSFRYLLMCHLDECRNDKRRCTIPYARLLTKMIDNQNSTTRTPRKLILPIRVINLKSVPSLTLEESTSRRWVLVDARQDVGLIAIRSQEPDEHGDYDWECRAFRTDSRNRKIVELQEGDDLHDFVDNVDEHEDDDEGDADYVVDDDEDDDDVEEEEEVEREHYVTGPGMPYPTTYGRWPEHARVNFDMERAQMQWSYEERQRNIEWREEQREREEAWKEEQRQYERMRVYEQQRFQNSVYDYTEHTRVYHDIRADVSPSPEPAASVDVDYMRRQHEMGQLAHPHMETPRWWDPNYNQGGGSSSSNDPYETQSLARALWDSFANPSSRGAN